MSKPLSKNNTVVLASAGSGKTTHLVEKALEDPQKRVLLLAYTTENLGVIRSYFIKRYGCVPSNVTLMSWYSFLLQEGVRPYQRRVSATSKRARSIQFGNLSPGFKKAFGKAMPEKYYFNSGWDLYQDRVSDFVFSANEKSSGAVIRRLESMFDAIYIDEVQDLNGWDLDVLELLFASKLSVYAVGDPRQATFSTNNSNRNIQYKGSNIVNRFRELEAKKALTIEERLECHRCHQSICDFADSIFPEHGKATSLNTMDTGHDGIFEIRRVDVPGYIELYAPTLLRWNRASSTLGLPALNMGSVKGMTFPRVLIFPTKPMLNFLAERNPEKAGSKEKLYVAVTRARHSVAFVVD